MIKLYGLETCAPCKQVKKLLENKKIPYEYIDALKADYTGLLPMILLDNGDAITGFKEIKEYIKTCVATVSYDVKTG